MTGRGAGSAPPRPTPLALIADAVAGGDLQSVAATAAEALRCTVAIAIPDLGAPVVAPPGALAEEAKAGIAAHAAAVSAGTDPPVDSAVAAAVPVRIGEVTVGMVAAVRETGRAASGENSNAAARESGPAVGRESGRAVGREPEELAWLEAAAAAASVTAVMRDSQDGADAASDAILLAELAAGPPTDLPGFLVRARRLGCDLTGGAVALSARTARTPRTAAGDARLNGGVARAVRVVRAAGAGTGALMAELRPGALLAVMPLTAGAASDPAAPLAAKLRGAGLSVAASAPRRDPALLHDAIREAELLAELRLPAAETPAGQDDTFRLLIGVLLRDRSELEQLARSTVTPLAGYDARHDTELIATLRAFLAHDGSTTETAEAMGLHRHTVGYRLARVHEVSGLSPYESDGRERLSLGLKAHQILAAAGRLEAAAHPEAR